MNGIIVKSNAGLYDVWLAETEQRVQAKSRGVLRHKGQQPVVGDHVVIEVGTPYSITHILERKNTLIRPLIANVDLGVVVISLVEPTFQHYLLDKYLATLQFHRIQAVIVLSKSDLLQPEQQEIFGQLIQYYQSIGYPVFQTNGTQIDDESGLLKMLSGKVTTVIGQSGVGKSTLLNVLSAQQWALHTNQISKALGRGKHTTRIVELYQLRDFWIADTPGFSSFQITQIPAKKLSQTFCEFAAYQCQFNDCSHINERRCGVKDAVNNLHILQARYENYVKLYQELKESEEHKKW